MNTNGTVVVVSLVLLVLVSVIMATQVFAEEEPIRNPLPEICYIEDDTALLFLNQYHWTRANVVSDWAGSSHKSTKSLLLEAKHVGDWPLIKMYAWHEYSFETDWSEYDYFVVDICVPDKGLMNPEKRDLVVMLEFCDTSQPNWTERAVYRKLLLAVFGEETRLIVPLREIEENSDVRLSFIDVWALQIQSTGSFAVYVDNIMLAKEGEL